MTKAKAPEFTKHCLNLAAPRIGAETLLCSDDFFAPMHRMLAEVAPVFIEDKYDDHGKWMDGWESRRKRVDGYDWCIIKLGVRGKIQGVEIDTSFFTGNFPPFASVQALDSDGDVDEHSHWHTIVTKEELAGDSQHYFSVTDEQSYTHVRLNIFPDGGVARLRVYGEPDVNWSDVAERGLLTNLAALECGAKAVAWSDSHYGDPNKMFSPNDGENMGDGWETRRNRDGDKDWLVFKLATAGEVESAIVDTAFFKGNFPEGVTLKGQMVEGDIDPKTIEVESENWPVLMERQKLSADNKHEFSLSKNKLGKINMVRVDIYPDGGISRLRILGRVAEK